MPTPARRGLWAKWPGASASAQAGCTRCPAPNGASARRHGPLTQELCLRAGRVTAIELDTTLRPVLAETVGEFDNLTIHFADAMKMDLPALVQAEFPGLTPAAYRRQTRLEQKNRSPEQDSRTRP